MAAALSPLLSCSEGELPGELSRFALPPSPDGRPDLLLWLPLLNRLDGLLEAAAARRDVRLAAAEATPFPTPGCLSALRVTALLLDGAHNRQLYASAEVRVAPSVSVGGGVAPCRAPPRASPPPLADAASASICRRCWRATCPACWRGRWSAWCA